MTHAIVNKQETRKLREIVEIVNVDPEGIAVTNTPFVWNAVEDQFYFKSNSTIFEKIRRRYGLDIQELEIEFRKRAQLIYNLFRSKIFGFKEVQDIISQYYKNPEEVLKRFEIE